MKNSVKSSSKYLGAKLLIIPAVLVVFITQMFAQQTIILKGNASGKRFDGIGVVNGGGATSVLLKDYPEPQRSQILDLLYKPNFGASVSALLVEIPGDGNSTQGSMPSHMHTREDLNYSRGYIWWILQEAKKRNPLLSIDGTAWSAPGWIGNGNFWSQDAADYYVKWLNGLKTVYGLELDAIGCRNEKGVSYNFVKKFRSTLNENGYKNVKIHAFDNWPGDTKLSFVKDMLRDEELRNSIDIISAHIFNCSKHASKEVQDIAAQMGKPIWDTEEHAYYKGFDCLINIVECFNRNYINSDATKIVNWYDIAGMYPMEPFSEEPAALLAYWPWSGHYKIREALWGYAHYGQFSKIGWQYLNGGCLDLAGGGSVITLKSKGNDYSVIMETKSAKVPQQIRFQISEGLSSKTICVWRSNSKEQFIRLNDIKPIKGTFTITLDPNSVYSLSTTRGQQKGFFTKVPESNSFPFPYYETFEQYTNQKEWGCLPRYFADIAGAFELVNCPDKKGKCIRQMVSAPTISWAPDWLPYTILGDEKWGNYEFSSDVYLNPGDTAAIMGRINHVGTGYGFIPKGYFLQLAENGRLRLVVIRGKIDKKKLIGDGEQQAIIKASKDIEEGGEKELGSFQLSNIASNQWYNLKIRFEYSKITGFVDGKPLITVFDSLYTHGMAGLMAGGDKMKLCTPYFDNVMVKALNKPIPSPNLFIKGQFPLYKR